MIKIEDQKIKYAAYRRKSTDDERQVLSLKSQKDEIEHRFPNMQMVEMLPESVSAFKPYKRPVFKQMMEMIEAGKVQGIVAWHPDRLSRNPMDAAQLIYFLDTGKLKDLKFCSYHFDNSPEGKMMLQIVMSQSKYSSDKLSKDVKRGMDTKATTSGYRPGHAPLGYLNSKTNIRGEETIFNDPVRFDLVKQVWQYALTGNYTASQILKIANEELHLTQSATRKRPQRSLYLSTLYRILGNPFYYGWYQWEGEWFEGKHQPMITEGEFNQVQRNLGRKGQPQSKGHLFAFTGLMRCGNCGAMITAEEKTKHQKNGNIHHYVYYRCTKKLNAKCPEKCIRLEELTKQIDTVLAGLHISEDFQKWAIHYLHELRKTEAQAQENALKAQQQKHSRVTKQLDNLLIKFTSPENEGQDLISDTDYKTLKSSLLKQKTELEESLQAQGRGIEEWIELSERTFNFARYARMWFEKGNLETKRAIFACLGSDLLLEKQRISFIMRKPFKFIFEGRPRAESELARLELPETAANIIDYRVLTQQFSLWSG
ncbi:MAG: recombinase family protein [Candidatus Yanofskybacteria bacterium]|nr:recombinase family protein [Candidatus Yanofskybacteria bacterium]